MDAALFCDALIREGVSFCTGVPDSFLHGFCSEISRRSGEVRNIIAANEGNAVAIATGYHLGTGGVPLVYLQNSGLGNAVNPLASLAGGNMLSIPLVLLIGWRGDPQHADHVQHELQGRITPTMLDLLDIDHRTISCDSATDDVTWAVRESRRASKPIALLVPKGVLSGEKTPIHDERFPLSRREAIQVVLESVPTESFVVATTGRCSRELYDIREVLGQTHARDVLNVGAMGHASSIAYGMALARPEQRIVCLDGDGAAIMHLGAFAMQATRNAPNLLHVVLNNGVHESVGNQPSAGFCMEFTQVARACGYATMSGPVMRVDDARSAIADLLEANRSSFLDFRIHAGINPATPGLEVKPVALRNEVMAAFGVGHDAQHDELLA